MLNDLIRKTRSFRRFKEDEAIDMETLRYLVDLARPGGSVRNVQPLKYLLVIVLGKPAESVSLNEQKPGADIGYWRDADQIHHVPKRPLQDIIAGERE